MYLVYDGTRMLELFECEFVCEVVKTKFKENSQSART